MSPHHYRLSLFPALDGILDQLQPAGLWVLLAFVSDQAIGG